MPVTTKMVSELRRRHRAGETIKSLAALFGISETTAYKYASEISERKAIARERKAYEKLRTNPEKYAVKKERAAAYWRAKHG
jgi:predicted transcriptional regulator